MKAVAISEYGGTTIYLNVSVEEAKERYRKENPDRENWDFTLGDSTSDDPMTAIIEFEITDKITLDHSGLTSIQESYEGER